MTWRLHFCRAAMSRLSGRRILLQQAIRREILVPSTINPLAPTSAASIDLIYQRHAVRAYTAERVDDTRIRALLDAAVHAPTAMHQEAWRFVVVQNRALLKSLSDRAKQMAGADAKAHGNLLRPPAAPGDGIASPLADPAFNIFYDASTLILICGNPANDFVAADCWLAAENLMLAAAAHGLGSCCIGFAIAALNTAAGKQDAGIPADLTVFAPIIVGVPHGAVNRVPRKPPVLVSWIR
jgi:nitroreductase